MKTAKNVTSEEIKVLTNESIEDSSVFLLIGTIVP